MITFLHREIFLADYMQRYFGAERTIMKSHIKFFHTYRMILMESILDVPVGTAVFTEQKWASLKNAHITCLDYSTDMLEQAEKRLNGCGHIRCVQGNVGDLQMDDAAFDVIVSMNGFHAFPNKEAAFRETWRVLKPEGKFIACFYIKGKSGITDWLVGNIFSKKGWFTPPFQTEEQLRNILNRLYKAIDFHVDGSIAYFCCTK